MKITAELIDRVQQGILAVEEYKVGHTTLHTNNTNIHNGHVMLLDELNSKLNVLGFKHIHAFSDYEVALRWFSEGKVRDAETLLDDMLARFNP